MKPMGYEYSEVTVTSYSVTHPREPSLGRWWWVFLVSGIIWILIGLFVLDSDFDSARLIGWLVGFWLLFAAVTEFTELAVGVGWKWLHALLAGLFAIGGIAAFLSPFQTFTVLAALFSLFLVLKGTFDIVMSLVARDAVDLWWLTLIVGVLQIVLGIWAAGYPGRSAALLILWIGIGAILRGIQHIVMAFQARKLGSVTA
jgi:uncharacterized membrane protein HdeD (DUF308 family)